MQGMVRVENPYDRTEDRQGAIPVVIANHDAHGLWPDDSVTVHFTVRRDGVVCQHADIWQAVVVEPSKRREAAASSGDPRVPVVADRPSLRPSAYSVLIGYEGGADGMTKRQFDAAVSLHQWIRLGVAEAYGVWFPLDRYHVVPLSGLLPGWPGDPAFPWEPLYSALSRLDEEHAAYDALVALETAQRKGLLA